MGFVELIMDLVCILDGPAAVRASRIGRFILWEVDNATFITSKQNCISIDKFCQCSVKDHSTGQRIATSTIVIGGSKYAGHHCNSPPISFCNQFILHASVQSTHHLHHHN